MKTLKQMSKTEKVIYYQAYKKWCGLGLSKWESIHQARVEVMLQNAEKRYRK